MPEIHVVGVAMSAFGKHLGQSLKAMTAEIVAGVMKDAQLDIPRIDAAFFSNATQAHMEGQFMIPGQVALRAAGIEGIPVFNVENACASGATAFHLACAQIQAGGADVVLAVGVEKMYHEDKKRSLSVFDGAWDVHEGQRQLQALLALGDGVGPQQPQTGQRSVFMDIYAAWARYHMRTFGSTQRQLAAVSAKNHAHSAHNPRSQFRASFTIEEVLAARSISWPLTLPMCSPISDGAAAALVCSTEALKRLGRERAVKVYASSMVSGTNRDPADLANHVSRRAALKAYETAGLGPLDMSVAEVHDATAFGEIQQSENLGFFEFGQGGWAAERGETALGGRIPINPSGGLESKGHPIGATGLAQIYELVTQLRQEAGSRQVAGARFAIAENGGGMLGVEEAAACVTILGRTGA